MPIKWTIIVLGALLHAMASAQKETTTTILPSISNFNSDYTPSQNTVPTTQISTTDLRDVQSVVNLTTLYSTSETSTLPVTPTPTPKSNTADPGAISNSTTNTMPLITPNPVSASSPAYFSTSNPETNQNTSLSPTNSIIQQNNSDSVTQPRIEYQDDQVTTPSSTNPTTQLDLSITSMPLSATKSSTQTTDDKETSTATQTESLTTPTAKLKTTVSQTLNPMETQTTTATTTAISTPVTVTSAPTPQNSNRTFDLSSSWSGKNIMFETCKALGQDLTGQCSVNLDIKNNQIIATITINADQLIQLENYQLQEKKEEKAMIPDTLIAILASCGALVLILLIFAAYCTYHRRSYRKNQQHLTEELQTVENGYHDNPTLEVMEVQPEMQEKKLALNGEFNDSWIVPIDNLLKDNIPDEEDTHL